MELDHIVIAVTDLAAAARELEARHGLASIEGGRHPGWGTANRIVPLGETYLELAAVIDEAEAAESVFGRWIVSGVSELGQPLGWAVRTHELDVIARRLGLDVGAGSRATPGGQAVAWRSVGIEQAVAEPSLPFFIEWGAGNAVSRPRHGRPPRELGAHHDAHDRRRSRPPGELAWRPRAPGRCAPGRRARGGHRRIRGRRRDRLRRGVTERS